MQPLKHNQLSMVILGLLLLTACTSEPNKKLDFTASSAHLQIPVAQSVEADQASVLLPSTAPSATKSEFNATVLPSIEAGKQKPALSTHQLILSHAPVRQVLQQLALRAKIPLSIAQDVDRTLSVNLEGSDPIALLYSVCEQAQLILTMSNDANGTPRYQVRADTPYWQNHFIHYLNVERQVSSSLMVANALGNMAGRTAQAITLGGQTNAATAVTQGSATAVLNQSKYDLWNSLQQSITRLLRAKHPELLSSQTVNSLTTNSTSQTDNASPLNSQAVSKDMSQSTQSTDGSSSNTEVVNTNESRSSLLSELPKLTAQAVYPLGTQTSELMSLNREGGFIAVFAPQSTQKDIANLIHQTQTSISRQVMIEATILEVELNDEHQAGVNWQALVDGQSMSLVSAFTGRDQNEFTSSQSAGLVTMTGSGISKDFSLTSTLKLLERYGQSRVLSSPKLMTMNHQPSLIKVVKNLVYFTMQAQVIAGQVGQSSTRSYVSTPNTVPIGLIMSIIPAISADQHITLAVRPTISSLSGVVDDPNPDLGDVPNRVPIIQERELESVLRLENGQVAVLGGLIQDVIAEEDTGIPGLVSAPNAGFLFGQKNHAKRKSELVIFLKPTLITADQSTVGLGIR